jgi:hypothetical protein
MLGCLIRGLADNRYIQATADYLGHPSNRHALFSDPVIPGPSGTLLKRQPVFRGIVITVPGITMK